MVIVFSPIGTLVETDNCPIASALHVVRKLESLNVPLVIAADLPRARLENAARAVDFRGTVISSRRPMTQVRSISPLPPASFWWVTASETEALDAQRAGYNAVFIVESLEELLPRVQSSYTKAALAVRQVIDDMFASAAESDTR